MSRPHAAAKAAKRARVLAVLDAHPEFDGVVLESPAVVSWYLDGARTTVPLGGASVIAVLVTRDGDAVRCPVNEIDRLRDEELVSGAEAVPWHEPLVPAAWTDDPRIARESQLDAELRAARASLLDVEVDRYRALGREVAAAVTEVAARTLPEWSENRAAGALADAVLGLGAEPVVLLVAGASRLGLRHPLPTGAPLGRRTMLVVGARRHGLIVNLTRWVRFDGLADDDRLLDVEAEVLDATRVGAPVAQAFGTLAAAYGRHGFDAGEWRNHHQGGATGYLGRDPKATEATPGLIVENQAFAWNPSAPGAKVEDTVLARAAGLEILTADDHWPTTLVAGRARPLALQP